VISLGVNTSILLVPASMIADCESNVCIVNALIGSVLYAFCNPVFITNSTS